MPRSMTGYGRGEQVSEQAKVVIEVKSVNHRFGEIVCRLPRELSGLEDRFKAAVAEKVARGRVDVYFNREEYGEARRIIVLDKELASSYYNALTELADHLQISQAVDVESISRLPEVMTISAPPTDLDAVWEESRGALDQALDNLTQMRMREGNRLADDIRQRVETIQNLVASIEDRAPLVVEEYRARLLERVAQLMGETPVDPQRLAAEVVLYAERSSITEETVRLYSHLDQVRDVLSQELPVGRKLDFLVQEINREVNTIGSKSSDTAIARAVVEVKSELEKIREQVQNIE